MNDKRQLFPCTACEAVRLWVLYPWYMNDLWAVETSLQKNYVFQIAFKGWPLFWFRNHLHQLSTVRCKSNPRLSKILHTFYCPYESLYLWVCILLPIWEPLSLSAVATNSLSYSLLPLVHRNLLEYYTILALNIYPHFSKIRL